MKSKWKLAATAAATVFACATTVQAQDTRMYAFSSGPLTIGKGVLQNFATMDPPIVIPVGFYVIKHPKGNILFDTGNNESSSRTRTGGPLGCKVSNPG